MKNRLNNKGFAVSTVVYAILLLLIILMFTILLLYRNTYRNQKQFNADVQDELNEHLIEQTPPDKNPPECILTSTKNADGSYKLTLSAGNSIDLDLEEGYYLEGKGYLKSSELTIKITKEECGSSSCTYNARTKDTSGNETNCSVTVYFDTTAPTCELVYDDTTKEIKIISEDTDLADKPFKFNDGEYSDKNTLPVSDSASFPITYRGKVKDKSGNESEQWCTITLKKFTATFKPTSPYSDRITEPTSEVSESCLSAENSCNITTPKLIVSSTSDYTYTAKGWSLEYDKNYQLVTANSLLELKRDITYYSFISREKVSSSGGSGSSCGCNPGGMSNSTKCVGGYIYKSVCESTGIVCYYENGTKRYKGRWGEYKNTGTKCGSEWAESEL